MNETPSKPFVFVLMPFSEEFDDLYQLGIKAACDSAGAYCERIDEQIFVENILERVYGQISKADIIVAEMTGRNPNVFYETGYAHALNKRVILLTRDAEDIPFDLKHYPHVIYGGKIALLRSQLETRVRWCIDNPQDSAKEEGLLSEISSLRAGFNQQANEVRQILKIITASESGTGSSSNKQASLLRPFEGIWRNEEDNITYYARVVGNELYIPYSYGGHRTLIGYYYNCKVIGETLFARFEWFKREISGYAFLKLKTLDELVGGWWYREDLPFNVLIDVARINPAIPKMNQYVLTRVKASPKFPAHVEKYFKNLLADGH